ncbi:MAG: MBL fold metallo-hydrolase RNA specificity domain-containing protein, partial [Promethearchaeota archaeon]
IIIEEDGYRIMLDNGMNFSQENEYYKDFLMPRKTNGIRDYYHLKLVPPIPGIYARSKITDICIDEVDIDARYMYSIDLESYEDYKEKNGKPYLNAFFLTHAHLDHVRNLEFMSPEIPVFLSDISNDLLHVLKDVSGLDYINFKKDTLTEYANGSYFAGEIKKKPETLNRNITIITPYEPIQIGPFQVTGYPVDHSIPGAMAYKIITNSGKKIVYTGDIRFHGLEQDIENSRKFVNAASSGKKTDVLITEGTRLGATDLESEDDVYNGLLSHVKTNINDKSKFIFISFPWKSVTRFITSYKIASKVGRTLVIQPKLAYFLNKIKNKPPLMNVNVLLNENIRIYMPRKSSMLYSDADYLYKKEVISYDKEWNREDADYKYYRDLYGISKHVKAPEIHHSPEKFIVHLDFYDLNELIDIDPRLKGGYFYKLKTEPIDEDGVFEQRILENWLKTFNLEYESFHASGHATPRDLFSMIEKINPDTLIPVHTEHPEMFKEKFQERLKVLVNINLDEPISLK